MAAGYTWLRLVLRAETPVLAVRRGVKNWYTATRSHISSRMVAGVLLHYLEAAGYSDIYKRYLRGGLLNATNFYIAKTSDTGLRRGLPAPVFSYRAKRLGRSMEEKIYVYEKALRGNPFMGKCLGEDASKTLYGILEEAVEEARRELSDALNVEADNLAGFVEKAAGSIISGPGNHGVYSSLNVEMYSVESVGIDAATYAGEKGVLYSYEAYGAGTLFHGLVAVEEGFADAVENAVGESLWIGRGGSRGYGEVVVTSVEAVDVERLVGRSLDKPLIALSPLLISSSPNGFLVISTGLESTGGWNRYYGVRKRWWRAHRPGSLLVPCRAYGLEEYMRLVAEKPGYNFAVPYTIYTWLITG